MSNLIFEFKPLPSIGEILGSSQSSTKLYHRLSECSVLKKYAINATLPKENLSNTQQKRGLKMSNFRLQRYHQNQVTHFVKKNDHCNFSGVATLNASLMLETTNLSTTARQSFTAPKTLSSPSGQSSPSLLSLAALPPLGPDRGRPICLALDEKSSASSPGSLAARYAAGIPRRFNRE